MRWGKTRGKQRQCVSVSACGNAVLPFETTDNVAGERESGSSNRSRGSFNPLAQILDALICSSEQGVLDKCRDDCQNHELIRQLTRETNVCLERGGGVFGHCFSTWRKCNERGRQNKTCDLFPAVKGWEKSMQCFMDFPIRVAFYEFFSATVSVQVHVCTVVNVKMTIPHDTVDRWIIFMVLTDP